LPVVAVVQVNSQMVATVESLAVRVVKIRTSALVVVRHKRLVAMQDVRQLTSMETKCAQAQEFNFAVAMQTLQARAAEVAISVEALVALCTTQDLVAAAAVGQRYLLTEDTGSDENTYGATAWLGPSNRPLVARANDIIEFNGSRWDVTFMADQQTEYQYITNLTTAIQYEWTGQQWIKSYQGIYPGGEWSLVL
jgi:hypothetical protein